MDGTELTAAEPSAPEPSAALTAETSAALTAEPSAALAADIEAAVRATPGVRSVYRAGSLVSNAIGAGAAALGVTPADESLVSVVPRDRGVVVTASIGIDFSAHAADTLRAVQGAIDDLLRTQGVARESIALTVVYVQSREAS